MSEPTGNLKGAVRSLFGGSEYYGLCSVCKQSATEVHAHFWQREYQRGDGQLFYVPVISTATYGHLACLPTAGITRLDPSLVVA